MLLALAALLIGEAAAGPTAPVSVVGFTLGEVKTTATLTASEGPIAEAMAHVAATCLESNEPGRDWPATALLVRLAIAAPVNGGKSSAGRIDGPLLVREHMTAASAKCIEQALVGIETPPAAEGSAAASGYAGLAVLVSFGGSKNSQLLDPNQTHQSSAAASAILRTALEVAEAARLEVATLEAAAQREDALRVPKIKYDRFTDHTLVSILVEFAPSPHNVEASFLAIYSGKKPGNTLSADFLFASQSTDWEYLKCHDTSMLLDDRQAALGEARHDGDVVHGGVLEQIIVPVPPQTRARLLKAKKIELRICNDEMTLVDPSGLQRALKALAPK